jgi:SagB-type dehydrogenase family enzyme
MIAAAQAAWPDVPGLRNAPLSFVFGSTFDRTAWKYTVRTYRYLGLDAGHVALNLAGAGHAVGLPCEPLAAFDDARLAAAFALDGSAEAPLFVLTCGGPAPPAHPPVSPRRTPASVPANADAIELTRLSSALTSWALTGGFDWLRIPPTADPAGTRRLDPSRLPSGDLFEVMRRRRSFREFDPRPVPAQQFANVLADASGVLGWTRGVPLVGLFVAVRAVEGIEPGTYRYDFVRHALSDPLRKGVPEIEAAGLDQSLLGRAAFVLAWALLDERAGTVEGARDFRHACLDAGFSGEAAYLTATALGLGICGVGAFYDDEVGELFASAGIVPRVIHLAGVGLRPDRAD